jgi:hypothetical protein
MDIIFAANDEPLKKEQSRGSMILLLNYLAALTTHIKTAIRRNRFHGFRCESRFMDFSMTLYLFFCNAREKELRK